MSTTPLVRDEQIYKRVDEYTLPYRTEITRVTKEFRDIYEAELQSMRERLSRMESRDVELIGHLRTMKADADRKRSKCLTSGHKRDAESLAALSEMFTKLIEWLKPIQQVAP